MPNADLTEANLDAAFKEARRRLDGRPLAMQPQYAVFECGEDLAPGDPVVWRDGKVWKAKT